MEYVKIYFTKKEHLTWDEMYQVANAEYKENQQKQMTKILNKKHQQEAAAEAKRIEDQKKEAAERLKAEAAERAKRQEEERLRQEEEDRKRQQDIERQKQIAIQKEIERQRRENEERRKKQLADKAAKEAHNEVKTLLSRSLINLSDESDEEEMDSDEKSDKLIPVPISQIKKEKDEKEEHQEKKDKKKDTKCPEAKVSDESVAELTKANLDRTLCEIGSLIVDPDVVYALRNLKTLGQSMKERRSTC